MSRWNICRTMNARSMIWSYAVLSASSIRHLNMKQTTLKAEAAGETFTAKEKSSKPPGWKAVYADAASSGSSASQYDAYGDYEDSEDLGEDFQNNDMYLKASEQALPVLHKGDTLDCHTHEYHKRYRPKLPPVFTEATLPVRLWRIRYVICLLMIIR